MVMMVQFPPQGSTSSGNNSGSALPLLRAGLLAVEIVQVRNGLKGMSNDDLTMGAEKGVRWHGRLFHGFGEFRHSDLHSNATTPFRVTMAMEAMAT